MVRVVAVGILLAGCAPQTVAIRGTLFSDRERGAGPLADATITAVTPPSGAVVEEVVTDADGSFTLMLPASTGIALEMTAPDYALTVFHGSTPISGELVIPPGDVFGITLAEVEAERALFAGCPAPRATMRLPLARFAYSALPTPIPGEAPVTSEGQVDVIEQGSEAEGTVLFSACYLNDDGIAYDDTASFTGRAGRFAVFGIDPGFYEIRSQWQHLPGQWIMNRAPAWVPDTDLVVALPQWPAWVDRPRRVDCVVELDTAACRTGPRVEWPPT